MADPTNENTPLDTDPAKGAAAELRALKDYIKNTIVPQLFRIPAGSMMFYGAQLVPTGFLECDGTAVSRTTYADLFAAIGVSFGVGNGTTTFNLPDLRGRVPRGWDHGAGVDTGRVFGSNQLDQVKAHRHNLFGAGSDTTGSSQPAAGEYANISSDEGGDREYTIRKSNAADATLAQGSQYPLAANIVAPDETRMKNTAALWIIKI